MYICLYIYVCMYVCMYVCITIYYILIYIYIFTIPHIIINEVHENIGSPTEAMLRSISGDNSNSKGSKVPKVVIPDEEDDDDIDNDENKDYIEVNYIKMI